jgi:hypothetical protein
MRVVHAVSLNSHRLLNKSCRWWVVFDVSVVCMYGGGTIITIRINNSIICGVSNITRVTLILLMVTCGYTRETITYSYVLNCMYSIIK